MIAYVQPDANGNIVGYYVFPNQADADRALIDNPTWIPVPPGISPTVTRYYVASGQLTEYTPTQRAAKETKVFEPDYAWNNTTMTWVDERPIEKVREERLAVLDAEIEAAKQAPIVVTGYGTARMTYADQAFLNEQVVGAALVAGTGFFTSILVPASVPGQPDLEFTIRVGRALQLQLAQRSGAMRYYREVIVAELEAATTVAAVNAVSLVVDPSYNTLAAVPSGFVSNVPIYPLSRAFLNSLATDGRIETGGLYRIITENRLALGTSPTTYTAFKKETE